MFKENTKKLLTENMCVDMRSIISKLETPELSNSKEDVVNFINSSTEIFAIAKSKNEFNELYNKYRYLHDNFHVNEVIDSIRHAYISFWEGGLLDLYTYQENEGWYPKIILKNELKPDDIKFLSEKITVYRGCSYKEIFFKKFGQSWSTSIDVAKLFAFYHYQGQYWFNKGERVVIKATIEKENIFYHNKSGEFEVVVDSDMLKDIKKIM